jgi:hypothetical protein
MAAAAANAQRERDDGGCGERRRLPHLTQRVTNIFHHDELLPQSGLRILTWCTDFGWSIPRDDGVLPVRQGNRLPGVEWCRRRRETSSGHRE